MASWNDFFGNNNYYPYGTAEWMSTEEPSGSVASQVIRFPPPQSYYYYYLNTSSAAPPAAAGYSYHASRSNPRVITTVELRVPICCEGCEERVVSRLIDIDGVQSVKCDQAGQKVTVSGTAHPSEVLGACKKLFKRSKWWSS